MLGYDRPLSAHKHYWHAMQVFLGHEERIIERHWGLILMF